MSVNVMRKHARIHAEGGVGGWVGGDWAHPSRCLLGGAQCAQCGAGEARGASVTSPRIK